MERTFNKEQKAELLKRVAGTPPAFLKSLTDDQKHIILKYDNAVKLRAVMRWKQRIARSGISQQDIANKVDKPLPRINEWVNLRVEPTEENFNAVEDCLYRLGC